MGLKLEDYRYDARNCPRCCNCKWVDHIYIRSYRFARICPISTRFGFNAYSAQGLLDIALALMDGRLHYTPGLLDAIYKCTLCGACDVRCKRNLDLEVLQTLEAIRARCVQDGAGPLPEHRAVAQRVKESGNRYGAPREDRQKWLPQGLKLPEKANIVYFAGCNSTFKQREIARATAQVLAGAGVQFTLLAGEECCGNPLISAGMWDDAGGLVQHNLEAIKATGASTVIASCAECYKTLKVDYPRLLEKPTEALGFQVLHTAEFVAQLVQKGDIRSKNPVDMRLTYHDSCQLGRLSEPWYPWQGTHHKFGILEPPRKWRRGSNGVYQPPRDILQSIPGIELVEMERRKEHAWCCGAGNGVRTAFKDFALWTAAERLEEARSAGAEAIVSACPYCKENLSEAAGLDGGKMKAYDLSEIVLRAVTGVA